MRSFRSMKYQIFAAAVLLLSGSYITAAADPTDQAQWSESIPLPDFPLIGPGERIEAYIVDGLLHARRLDQTDNLLWHLIVAEADPNQPPALEYVGAAVEVRHANGAYFVRDTFSSSTLAAHRQQLPPEAFPSLDLTVRENGIDLHGSQNGPSTPAQLQKRAPLMIAQLDSTSLDRLQKIPPEEFPSLDPMTLAILQELRPEAFASLDSTSLAQLQKPPPETSEWNRGIFKWEKNQQLWVGLGPNMDHWDALICLTPTVFVPEKPAFGPIFLRWDDAQLHESGGVLIARYVSPAEANRKQQEHKLVRGAVPFNIEAQRWINPIGGGDRIGWFLGKAVLLHFWATWSPESIEQLSHYDELYEKHKDQGLVVIAVHSSEGADDLDAFIAERGYELPIAVDEGASAQRYGIWNFPQSVLLDRDCRLAWISQDGEMPSPAQLKYLLDDIDTFPAH
ncbi:MAG: TlpA disulfide reductase family protein [Gemmatimonadetes bacterium]|nr:TlpA disulfide reductase family protein [Gemmatimonadota bacterium]